MSRNDLIYPLSLKIKFYPSPLFCQIFDDFQNSSQLTNSSIVSGRKNSTWLSSNRSTTAASRSWRNWKSRTGLLQSQPLDSILLLTTLDGRLLRAMCQVRRLRLHTLRVKSISNSRCLYTFKAQCISKYQDQKCANFDFETFQIKIVHPWSGQLTNKLSLTSQLIEILTK